METVYVYDGSFEGLLTAVFDTYVRKEEPILVSECNNFQLLLDTFVYNVITDEEKAERVIKKVYETAGNEVVLTILRAFLSKEQSILHNDADPLPSPADKYEQPRESLQSPEATHIQSIFPLHSVDSAHCRRRYDGG